VRVAGAAVNTLGALTSASTGRVSIRGTLSASLGSLTLSSTAFAGVNTNGQLNATLGLLTLSASGIVEASNLLLIPQGTGGAVNVSVPQGAGGAITGLIPQGAGGATNYQIEKLTQSMLDSAFRLGELDA
jgi:hypothetical protein